MANSLEFLTRQIIGKIGEDVPPSEFTDILHLNNIRHNFPVFDIIAKKDGEVYAFSVKARKRYGKDGKINPCYNILYGSNIITRKYKKALDIFSELDYDISNIHYCFLIAPIEENKDCIYYWGEFTELQSECTTENILNGCIKFLGVPVSEDDLHRYKIFGYHSWSHICDKYLT